MNIFYLHPDPRRCARWHCDKHVVKMLLEACQLLFTCHWYMAELAGLPEPPYLHCAPRRGYKPVNPHHPCGKWLRESLDNYRWLIRLAHCLVDEYHFRYGNKTHACEEQLEWLTMVEPLHLSSKGFTPPAQAMPLEYKHRNPIVAYRLYYRFNKDELRGIVKYTKRCRPHFLTLYNGRLWCHRASS